MAPSNGSHPDADIFPHATAAAQVTAESHKDELPLKFYAGWFCPFVQRAWMILEEKKIPYQYIEVNPYNKPQSLLDLNPRGLVPTLQYHDKPLYESTVICDFLDEAYKGHGPDFQPKDLYVKARMRIWSDFITSRLVPSFFRFLQKQPNSKGESDQAIADARNEFLAFVKEYTKEMDESGPYFLGDQPMMIDFLIAPWAIRFWVLDEFKGAGLPKEGAGGDDEQIWVRWRKFVTALEGRKSVKDTTSAKEHYIPLYRRYAEDKAQSEMAKATRAGRGVP